MGATKLSSQRNNALLHWFSIVLTVVLYEVIHPDFVNSQSNEASVRLNQGLVVGVSFHGTSF